MGIVKRRVSIDSSKEFKVVYAKDDIKTSYAERGSDRGIDHSPFGYVDDKRASRRAPATGSK